MPALIRKMEKINKSYLIFYIHAESNLLRDSIYSCTIFPLIFRFWNCCAMQYLSNAKTYYIFVMV